MQLSQFQTFILVVLCLVAGIALTVVAAVQDVTALYATGGGLIGVAVGALGVNPPGRGV